MNVNLSQIDVFILAGGLGSRLKAVVGDRPKPMADIQGRPFVGLLIEHLCGFGFRRILLGIGHMADVVERAFAETNWPCEVVMVKEDEPLGTGGAVRNALGTVESDMLLVLNGDSFCAVDYNGLVAAHTETAAEGTVAVVEVDHAADYGSIAVDGAGRITSFDEKSGSGRALVNAGIYLFNRSTVESFSAKQPLSIETEVFPVLTEGALHAYRAEGPLIDIGTPERYDTAREILLEIMKI